MAQISQDKYKTIFSLIIIMAVALLIIVIIITVPKTISNLNNGNSTEIAANNTDIFFILQPFVSIIISLFALFLTYKSLEITRDTLQRTELEQQKRDLEHRLELFYYPMSYYFQIKPGRETKDGLNEDDRRERIRAYQHRFKAEVITREQFEKWYEYITRKEAETGKAETGKAETEVNLIEHIKTDITNYEGKIQDLNKQIQALTTYKKARMEVSEVK